MWLPTEIWNMGWMIIGIILLSTLAIGILKFMEWWFHRGNKGE